MKIAIASGKGGTGKTTLAVNLATTMAEDMKVGLLDCDVEEPNCHLYLKPAFEPEEPITVPVPRIDPGLCTACGLCARSCRFHALLALPGGPLSIPELCHGCGVCEFVCPNQAISDESRQIGDVAAGDTGGLYLRWGRLRVGEARSTGLIRAVKELDKARALDLVIVDAPPGVACPAVEAMRGADVVVLVTEPTRFGLHDLCLALETTRRLGIPHGVVVNRAGIGDDRVERLCAENEVPVLLRIPEDRGIAQACSRGEIRAATDRKLASALRTLGQSLCSVGSLTAAPAETP
jgi:MinD superfamily P-loop ATPase